MNQLRDRLREKMKSIKPGFWVWIAAAMVSGFMAFYWDATAPRAEEGPRPENVENAATYIPAGYVLVPIEVSNFEALDSILGKFGIVDLYVSSEDPKVRPRKVAERVRILRAPLNPSRFAVLARESESPRLVSHSGPFLVVIQNPARSGTGFVNGLENEGPTRRSGRRRSRISVEAMDEKIARD